MHVPSLVIGRIDRREGDDSDYAVVTVRPSQDSDLPEELSSEVSVPLDQVDELKLDATYRLTLDRSPTEDES